MQKSQKRKLKKLIEAYSGEINTNAYFGGMYPDDVAKAKAKLWDYIKTIPENEQVNRPTVGCRTCGSHFIF